MPMTLQALVIDDELSVRGFVAEVLKQEGWEVTQVDSAEHAFEVLHERDWSAVFCDVVMGGADGFSVLRRFKEELPNAKVVLMTGYGTAAGAMDASVLGAFDYLLKPFGVEAVQSLSRAIAEDLRSAHREQEVSHPVATNPSDLDINLVSRSEIFIKVMQQVGRVATTNLPVLLVGESGTGKEAAASALHRRSRRADMPFVAVNCGAIPAESIEAELFGRGSGSIAGTEDSRGLWQQADGGTLFLNEIDETTPAFQVKVLRALQEGGIRPPGSTQPVAVDVRLVAASKLDIEGQVQVGKFRQDLFYSLNAVSIVLPPLRERREDILPLAHSFAERVNLRSAPIAFSEESLDLLQSYPWPGNIRELENTVARAVALCEGRIRRQDLPERVRNYQEEHRRIEASKEPKTRSPKVEEDLPSLAEIERQHVTKVLAHTKGNKQAAARLLKVDRKTLDRMIKRHKIQLPRGTGAASR